MGVEMRILNMEPDQDKSAFFPVVKFICTTESDTNSYPLGKETFIKWPADSVSKIEILRFHNSFKMLPQVILWDER